jgi:hypothetical protein
MVILPFWIDDSVEPLWEEAIDLVCDGDLKTWHRSEVILQDVKVAVADDE